ncbi:MAG: Unknown protein [uncultured Sulfurovum sp.]|uniref:Uncharacterized protein n=1 Tax=uncultured Sulfurovum sp. TaxID=269237 RepID=A0A6S6UBA3_9BACT|nr:MAG: Unknown protein [uncultured Sulfurovum sp.]
MQKLYISITVLFLTFTLFANASTSNTMTSELMMIVKQQQYLAKKVSDDYIAFQADQKNANKKMKMKKSIQSFNKNHLKLITNKNNTKMINQKLTKVDKIWKIAHKLSETKKHSVMLVTSMDDIGLKMKELRSLYQKTSK